MGLNVLFYIRNAGKLLESFHFYVFHFQNVRFSDFTFHTCSWFGVPHHYLMIQARWAHREILCRACSHFASILIKY